MPGSVANAAPATVMPHALCRAYSQARHFEMSHVEYSDGTRERALQVATSRRRWQLTQNVSAAALATLRAFYEARGGAAEPFWIYDVWDVRDAAHDPTGVATLGRVTVRFDSAWSQTAAWPRSQASFELVEVN